MIRYLCSELTELFLQSFIPSENVLWEDLEISVGSWAEQEARWSQNVAENVAPPDFFLGPWGSKVEGIK
jgi:hypothetical protein